MITTLNLTNFLGYHELELDLAPVTVVIGSNASGKSTLLSALAILGNGVDKAAHAMARECATRQQIRNGSLLDLADRLGGWDNVFHRSDKPPPVRLEITGTFDNQGSIRSASLTVTRELCQPKPAEVELDAHFALTGGAVAGFDASCVLLNHMSTFPLTETYLSDDEFEKAAQCGATLTCIRNAVIRMDDESIARINLGLHKLAGTKIVSRTRLADAEKRVPLAVYYESAHHAFEIGQANHGLVSALALLTNIELSLTRHTITGARLMLLDEPEVHLNQKLQATFAQHLADAARATGAQIVFVTHSDAIVRQLLPRHDTSIISIEQPFTRLRRIHTQRELLKALHSTRDLAPYAAVNFLSSRKIALVEGPTDEIILHRAAAACFAAAPKHLSRFEEWRCVPLDGVDNAPSAGLIERLFSSSFLPQLKPAEIMIVARIRDRDYTRTQRLEIHRKRQVVRVEKVWSRHSIESLWMDEDVLTPLLVTALDPELAMNISELIKEALAGANVNEELLGDAEAELAQYYRKSRQFDGEAASIEARNRVRANPEVWQRGKDREDVVLCSIRSKLPASLQNRLRGTIAKILDGIPSDQLAKITVPSEIKKLLDQLVTL
jgi:predicted ATPase